MEELNKKKHGSRHIMTTFVFFYPDFFQDVNRERSYLCTIVDKMCITTVYVHLITVVGG
jgi:hypothetical protein